VFGQRRAAEVAGTAKAIQEDTQRALETLKGLRSTVQGAWDLLRNKPKPDTDASRLFGEYEKGLQMDAIASHLFAKRFKEVVPDEVRRSAITNWIQAGGDVDTLAKWEQGSKDEDLRAGYKAAQSLTPDEVAMAKELKAYYDENNKEDLAAGFYDQAKANYMMQVYEADAQPFIQSVLSGSTMQPEPGIFKHSQFRNYFEAESAGKKPRNKDAAVLTLDYDRQRSEALRGRAYIRGILNMREADGRPMAILKREGEIMQIGKANEPYLVDWNELRDDGKDPYRMDYRYMPVPAMTGWLWQVGDLDLEDMRPSEVTRYNDAEGEVGENAVGKHVMLNDDGHRVIVRGLQSFEPNAPDYWPGAMLPSVQVERLLDALKREAAAHAKKVDLIAHRGTKALMRAVESARNEDGHTILYAQHPDLATMTEEVTHLYQVSDDLQPAVVRAMMPVAEPVEVRLRELGYPQLSAADLVAEVTAKAIANDAEVQWAPGERAQVVEAYRAALEANGVPMDRLPAMREDGESEGAGYDDQGNALQDAAGQGSGGAGAERGAGGAAREGANADGDAAGGPAGSGQAKPRPDGKTLLKRAVDKARAEKQANGEPDAEKDQRDLVGYVNKAAQGLSDDADFRVPALEEPRNTEPRTQGKAVAQPLGRVSVKAAPDLAGPTALDRLRRRMGYIPEAKRGLANIEAVLTAAGAAFRDVVKTTVYLKDLGDFAAINALYGQRFSTDGASAPARSAVQVAALPKDCLIEIECVAVLN
jgi:reactive intermediate/imine deaminase